MARFNTTQESTYIETRSSSLTTELIIVQRGHGMMVDHWSYTLQPVTKEMVTIAQNMGICQMFGSSSDPRVFVPCLGLTEI